MRIEPQLFVAAKPGQPDASCQDTAWVDCALRADGTAGFAVADGASGGWDGRLWAELVVDATARAVTSLGDTVDPGWLRGRLGDAIDDARRRWEELHRDLGSDDDPIAALAHAKYLSTGGHCTLTAGLIGPVGTSWRLRAFAVGDTVVFHLRPTGGLIDLRSAQPIEESARFGASPHLVPSKLPPPGVVVPGVEMVTVDDLAGGDVILIATDAFAEWALARHEADVPVWDVLAGLDRARFTSLLHRIRATRELVADDVLLLRLALVERPLRTSLARPVFGANAGRTAQPGDGRNPR